MIYKAVGVRDQENRMNLKLNAAMAILFYQFLKKKSVHHCNFVVYGDTMKSITSLLDYSALLHIGTHVLFKKMEFKRNMVRYYYPEKKDKSNWDTGGLYSLSKLSCESTCSSCF